jgi:hypothetical protein
MTPIVRYKITMTHSKDVQLEKSVPASIPDNKIEK